MGSFLDKLLRGIKQVYRNGTPMPQEPVINFINAVTIVDNPTLGSTDVYLPSTGGSGGGSLLIIENNGTPMPVEPILNFVNCTVVDEPGFTRTTVSPAPTYEQIENNGVAVTQRQILNFIGATVADDAPHVRTNVTIVPAGIFVYPGGTISGTATVGVVTANEFIVLYTGGVSAYTLTIPNLTAGQRMHLVYVGGGTLLEVNKVTLSHGGASYTLESAEDRSVTPGATQDLTISWQSYTGWLDPAGILRWI